MSIGYPLPKEDFIKCQKFLEGIESDPGCGPFLQPVAWEGK